MSMLMRTSCAAIHNEIIENRAEFHAAGYAFTHEVDTGIIDEYTLGSDVQALLQITNRIV